MEYFDPRGGANRYKIKIDFFKTWSNEMAYVLGFLYADGDIVDAVKSSRTQYIKFSSKDKDILEVIKSILQAEHPIHYRPPRETLFSDDHICHCSTTFYLRIGSRRIFTDLKKLKLTPNKSKIVRFPDVVSDEYLSHFVRGYLDGDGCVSFRIKEGQKKKFVVQKLSIIFTSGSKKFLERLNTHLSKVVSITNKRVYNSKRAYQLCYSSFDSIELFKFLYRDIPGEAYLKRKFNIFLKYFQLRPDRVDNEVRNIIDNL